MWLAWRNEGDFTWISQSGEKLPRGPGPNTSAFVCVDLREDDEIEDHPGRQWMTLFRLERPDQLHVLYAWEYHDACAKLRTFFGLHAKIPDDVVLDIVVDHLGVYIEGWRTPLEVAIRCCEAASQQPGWQH